MFVIYYATIHLCIMINNIHMQIIQPIMYVKKSQLSNFMSLSKSQPPLFSILLGKNSTSFILSLFHIYSIITFYLLLLTLFPK